MALAQPSDFASMIKRDIDPAMQTELVNCVAYAQSWIAREAGLRSLEKEASAVTFYLDGCDANGDELWLPHDVRPVWHSTPDLMTVSENGVALTPLAIGYSSTAAVVFRGVNQFKRVSLYRPGGWYWSGLSPQNIAISCKVGWHLDTGVLIVPPDVQRLVIKVAWKMFNTAGQTGITSVNKAGTAISWVDELSPTEQATLDRLRGV
jgi:hypothetical protein